MAYALVAGLMWDCVRGARHVARVPNHAGAGRYIAFNVVALVHQPYRTGANWLRSRGGTRAAFKLTLVGSIVYYLFPSAAIQAGGVRCWLALIGTLPVVIAVAELAAAQSPVGNDWRRRWDDGSGDPAGQ